jgi:hypothetical protein
MSRLGAPNRAIADRAAPIDVSVITLDRYCEETGTEPDWLFIDIEGFEIAALAGAKDLIRRRRASLGIIIEMHPNVWDSAGITRNGAEALLDELGLQAVPLTGQTDILEDHGLVHLAYQ